MSLTIGEERSGSIASGKRDYYIFEAEQGVKYSITVTGTTGDKFDDKVLQVGVVVFCYDTEEALLKEAVGSFTALRSGKIVIRISTNRGMKYTINVKLM